VFKKLGGLHNGTSSNIRRSTATAGVGLLKNTQALSTQQSDAAADALVDAACGRSGSMTILRCDGQRWTDIK